ncbi:hypothetical protein [Propioniciclava sinopodophylli]|uniref:aggregation-promoting factor C-terminal-like domain-containing protein n=1 Tax=Propioniciclava sinopodophylli TaxID=1837344 RepID=UPI0024926DF6|nr:hypothetical protein [Propioniciclava sinopodophylli]
MPFLSPLRAIAASTVALAVTASAGLVLASAPEPGVGLAVPAEQDAAALVEAQRAERQALITSRAAEREALQTALMVAVEQRNAALTTTSGAIDATEAAIQQQRAEQAAAEKAAAEKAAAEKKAAEKKAAAPQGGSRSANKELGRHLAATLYGWTGEQFTCYDNIIMRESLWDQYADNPTSSAYGIPQALPGKRMASEGADWKTNPATQIKWGLKYVKERYGTPCKAWAFKRAKGWY